MKKICRGDVSRWKSPWGGSEGIWREQKGVCLGLEEREWGCGQSFLVYRMPCASQPSQNVRVLSRNPYYWSSVFSTLHTNSSVHRWWFSPFPQPSWSCWASLFRACKKRDLFPKCNLDRSVGGHAGPLSILRHSVCLDFVICPPHFEHCQS